MTHRMHRIIARRIWDSRGIPLLEVDVLVEGGGMGRACASPVIQQGPYDATVLRDGGAAFAGQGVGHAVAVVNGEIARVLSGLPVADQAAIDRVLIEIDGTPNKARIGAHTTMAVSLAVAEAAANVRAIPLWQCLAGRDATPTLPMPVVQVVAGARAAAHRLDVRDVSIIAIGAEDYVTALDWSAEVYRHAGELIAKDEGGVGVAATGGWWPSFESNEKAIEWVVRAIERAGFAPGEDIALSVDIGASHLGRRGQYALLRDGRRYGADQLIGVLLGWLRKYPIVSVIDPLGDDDGAALARFATAAGHGVETTLNAGTATDARRIAMLAAQGAGNGVLLRPTEIGTLTEAKAAVDAARANGFGLTLAAGDGDTCHASLMHLAVGWGIERFSGGGFSRGERMALWNEGLRMVEQMPQGAALPPRTHFKW
jgi:enolase